MKKDLKFTFCVLAVTTLVSAVVLSGCSGNTAAPGAFDTESVSSTAAASRDEESMGAVSSESEELGAEIEAEDTDGQKLRIMASFYPMYGFTVKTGSDKAEVTDIVPADIEPHDREPAAIDIKNLEEVDLFVYSGVGMEHWADGVFTSLETKHLVSTEVSAGFTLRSGHNHDEEEHKGTEGHAEEGEHDHGQLDPYVWLSPVNAKGEVENVRNTYVKVGPGSRDCYEDNYKTYAVRLDKPDQEYKDALSVLSGKSIIVSYEVFSYFCDTYGLTQMGIAGFPPDTEPNPARMVEVIGFVETNHVKVILFEGLVSPKVAETIAAETGARTRVLDPLEGLSGEELKNGVDYFTVMEDNLKQPKAALE